MKRITTILVLLVALAAASLSTGCAIRPIKYETAGPNETVFAIPLMGDRANQAQLYSEESLSKNKVSAKRFEIPQVKIYDSAMDKVGHWVDAVQVVKIDLRPVVRQWTGSVENGTAAKNQELVAETRESVGFSSEWNCSASVNEANAAKFVHFYYGKSLDEVMDTQIRPYVQQAFTAEVAKYTLSDAVDDNGKVTTQGFLTHKGDIAEVVNKKTTAYFAERGINIMVLGMQGEVTYLNPEIQKSIDERIKAQNAYLAQKAVNQKTRETADALKYQAAQLSGDTALRLKELDIKQQQIEVQKAWIAKWGGNVPATMLGGANGSNLLLQLPGTGQ